MAMTVNKDLPQEIEVKFKMKLGVKINEDGSKKIPVYFRHVHERADVETDKGKIIIGGCLGGYTFQFSGVDDMNYKADINELFQAITEAFEEQGFDFGGAIETEE